MEEWIARINDEVLKGTYMGKEEWRKPSLQQRMQLSR